MQYVLDNKGCGGADEGCARGGCDADGAVWVSANDWQRSAVDFEAVAAFLALHDVELDDEINTAIYRADQVGWHVFAMAPGAQRAA